MTDSRRCRICGRMVMVDALGTDLSGRPVLVLVWHYTKTKKECPGSGRAAYLPGEYPPRKKGRRP